MAKYYGAIGYSETTETAPGVWEETITERNYYGDVIKTSSKFQSGENLNDTLTINHQFRIVSDPYAYQNFYKIRYVKWMGAAWKVTNVEVQSPRLILSIGGLYNENAS